MSRNTLTTRREDILIGEIALGLGEGQRLTPRLFEPKMLEKLQSYLGPECLTDDLATGTARFSAELVQHLLKLS